MEDVLRSFGPGVTSGNERGEVGQSRLGEQPAAMHRGVSSGDDFCRSQEVVGD